MDFITTTLGLELPPLRARDCLAVAQQRRCGVVDVKRMRQKIVWGCNEFWDVPEKTHCHDDETASTVSESDNNSISSSSSSESLSACVTFAAEVVTAVFERPYTDKEEKHVLYYNEKDYRQFRMDFRRSLYRKKPTVTFSTNVVSQVHMLPVVENKEDVYYSSAELKKFLEDFILSLDDRHS